MASGFAKVGLRAEGSIVIAGRVIPCGKATTVPQKNENVDATGLLPARLFKAA
jgi:hypothetical protein